MAPSAQKQIRDQYASLQQTITNHRNVVSYNANFGSGAFPASPSATYGQVLAVGEPRSLQLAARLRF